MAVEAKVGGEGGDEGWSSERGVRDSTAAGKKGEVGPECRGRHCGLKRE